VARAANRPSPSAPIHGWGHMLYRFSEPIELAGPYIFEYDPRALFVTAP
jgi:hypothetical protein